MESEGEAEFGEGEEHGWGFEWAEGDRCGRVEEGKCAGEGEEGGVEEEGVGGGREEEGAN